MNSYPVQTCYKNHSIISKIYWICQYKTCYLQSLLKLAIQCTRKMPFWKKKRFKSSKEKYYYKLSKLKSIHTLFQLYFNKDFICNVHVIYFEYIRIYFNLLQRSRRLVSGRLFFEGSEQHTCDLPVWSPDKLRGSDGRFGSRGQYQTSWKDLLLQMNSVNFYKKNNDKTLI